MTAMHLAGGVRDLLGAQKAATYQAVIMMPTKPAVI
jgi:hypothetical protein